MDDHRRRHGAAIPWRWLHALALVLVTADCASASKWTISPLNSLTLSTGSFAVQELSGATYLGPSPVAGKHRFAAIQDENARLNTIDVQFSLTGSLTSAVAVSQLTLDSSDTTDFEGIAYTGSSRNTYFVSNEGDGNDDIPPGLDEYDAAGNVIRTVTIPQVFNSLRHNNGFEALARNSTGTKMWLANEEALEDDGPRSSLTAPTTVRIVEVSDSGAEAVVGKQYAYQVNPIHGGTTVGSARSGLAELLSLPDGTLLTLERSAANTLPPFQNRFYEVDFTGATDISVAPYANGLIGDSHTAISNAHGKTLLWSGPAGGGLGQNMEGIALGPRLDNGSWVILGVVDNGGSGGNTILSFLLTANASADFDNDGDVASSDFLAWQRGLGTTIGASHSQGDADRDGDVDAADLVILEGAFAALTAPAPQEVPEPATAVSAAIAAGWLILQRRAGRGGRA